MALCAKIGLELMLGHNMWDFDPIDLWAAVIIAVVYSGPFIALLVEFKLRERKQAALQREILRRLTRRH